MTESETVNLEFRWHTRGKDVIPTAAAVLFGVIFLFSFAVESADSKRWGDLERYKKRYDEEIYEFCKNAYLFDPALRQCMRRQTKIKNNILADAIDRTGSYDEAIEIYRQCLEYYPIYGVGRIGACVDTMLVLDRKLDDDIAERLIYQKCDEKWRKHGPLSVRNCAGNSANYYRLYGEFRD